MSLPPVTLIWFDVLGRTHRRDTNCGTHIKKKIRGEKYLHIRWPGRRRGRWSEWSSFWALYPVRLWRPGQVDSTTGRVTLANYLVKQTTRKHSSHVLFLPKGEFKDYFTAKWHEVGKLHLRASLFRKKKRVNYSTSQQGSTNTHRLKKKKKTKLKEEWNWIIAILDMAIDTVVAGGQIRFGFGTAPVLRLGWWIDTALLPSLDVIRYAARRWWHVERRSRATNHSTPQLLHRRRMRKCQLIEWG